MSPALLVRGQSNGRGGGYLLAGVVGAVAFGAIAAERSADVFAFTRLLVIGFALGWVTVSDLCERRIPNRVMVPAAGICLGSWLVEGRPPAHLLLMLMVVVSLLGFGLFSPRLLGMGDVKLLALLVVGLGAAAIGALVVALVISSVAALAWVIAKRGGGLNGTLPLAPFLCLAACATLAL